MVSQTRKPQGGFYFLSVVALCRLWQAYHSRRIRWFDVRVWCAAVELLARRCQLSAEQRPIFTYDELTVILGGGRGVPSAVARLQACGLLIWELHRLTIPQAFSVDQISPAVQTMLVQITNSKRRIPVPRRVIRFIAKGCSRVMVATILGHLFRCLYYRNGQCQPDGRCKASWIADVFGVSARAVKSARQQLETCGLLTRLDTPQWLQNRYGPRVVINLQWDPTAAPPTPVLPAPASAPPLIQVPPPLAPLDSHKKTLSEENNQEPAVGRPTGVLSALVQRAKECLRTGTTLVVEPDPPPQRPQPMCIHKDTSPLPPQSLSPPPLPSLKAPTLHHITQHDLRDTTRTLQLYEQSVKAQLMGKAEADRLTFVALAQHVLHVHPQNPGGLFRQLLIQRRFVVITQADEDVALRRLKAFAEHSAELLGRVGEVENSSPGDWKPLQEVVDFAEP